MKAEMPVCLRIANHVPHLILAYDPQCRRHHPKRGAGAPPQHNISQIELNPATGSTGRLFGPHSNENTIVVGTWMLCASWRGREIVGRQLARRPLTQKA